MFTAGAATGAAQTLSPWWFVLPPIAGVLVSVLGVWLVVSREKRQTDGDKARREERLDHTADAVLGYEGDWRRGRAKVVGLVEKVEDQGAKLDQLVNAVHEIRDNVHRIAGGQSDAAHQLENHQVDDIRQFQAFEQSLNRLRDTVTQLAERREQP